MGRRVVAALLVAAVVVCAPRGARCADDAPKPLPVGRTANLGSGGVFYVEGRVRIPKGVSIQLQKSSKVVGRGEGGGVIEVEGELQVHGTDDCHDTFHDVTIEAMAKFAEIHVDETDFDGTSLGVRTAKDVAADGRVFLQNSTFAGKATVDLVMTANEVDLHRLKCPNPVRVCAVDPAGAKANKVKLMVMNCLDTKVKVASLTGGLSVENVSDATVRGNRLGGDKVSFADCGVVTFDGNCVVAKTLEFTQKTAGRMGRSEVSKSDLMVEKFVAWAPCVEGRADSLVADHCWFQGETKYAAIRDRFLKDRSSDPKCGATIEVKKATADPNNLGWTVK
jgi:hypothetical protein